MLAPGAGVAAGVVEAAAGAAAGAFAEVLARLVFEPEPPPPPQATRVLPNAAIAAIRIARVWSGRVMAVFRKLLIGIDYCLKEFLKVTPKQNL